MGVVGFDLGGLGSMGTFFDLDVGEFVAGGVNEDPRGDGIVLKDEVLDKYDPGCGRVPLELANPFDETD